MTRKLLALAAPIAGTHLLGVLMLVVDTAVCARLPGSRDALVALGFCVQVLYLLMVAIGAFTVGAVALVSRAHGAGDHRRVSDLFSQLTILCLLLGAGIGILGAVAARPILIAVGATPQVAALGVDYLRPLMFGFVFWCLVMLITGVLRGLGNTRVPFLCALAANAVNAVLCVCLVLGKLALPSLGISGAAVATVLANLTNLGLLIWFLSRSGGVLRLRFSFHRIDWRLARELFGIGAPAAVDMLIGHGGLLAVVVLLARIDDAAVAAHTIAVSVQCLGLVPGLSISQATSALVGQALGAGDVDRARALLRTALLASVAVMSAIALFIIAMRRAILAWFDVELSSAVHAHGLRALLLLGATLVPVAAHLAIMGLLHGAGATRITLRVNVVTVLFVLVPTAWLLAFAVGLGASGVWIAFPLAFGSKALLEYIAYRRGGWAMTGSVSR